jgi:hypothetical protein
MKLSKLILLVVATISTAAPAFACDLCGCAVQPQPFLPETGFFLGATEQFTHYGTIQDNGHDTGNPAGQHLDSSITQFYLGNHVTKWLTLQFNVPLISRSFQRTNETGIEAGTLAGIGDVSFLVSVVPLRKTIGDFTFLAQLTGGVKFPTGASSHIAEEAEEGHVHGAEEGEEHEHAEGEEEGEEAHEEAAVPESGIHGHDLALGSGSVDGIVGGRVDVQWKRLFFSGEVQYAIRSTGDFDYRYANDLSWNAGLGVEIISTSETRLALSCNCSGETKGEDTFQGEKATDTSATTVYVGPRITATWRERLTAAVQFDFPVLRENSGVQAVPDYRLRAMLGWQF